MPDQAIFVLGDATALGEALLRRLGEAGVTAEYSARICVRTCPCGPRCSTPPSRASCIMPFRATLELLGIRRCAAVAAATSTDLVNVEVGLAASELAPGIPLVLRMGDGQVAAETDSLLHLGRICDAHAIAADTLVDALLI